jgi:hypothetical protein
LDIENACLDQIYTLINVRKHANQAAYGEKSRSQTHRRTYQQFHFQLSNKITMIPTEKTRLTKRVLTPFQQYANSSAIPTTRYGKSAIVWPRNFNIKLTI